MNIVTATKSNNTITVLVNDNGSITPIPVTSEHPKWNDILKAWAEQNFETLLELMSMKRIVERFSNSDLVVSDNGVFYKDVPLVGIDVDRIMAFLRQNEPYEPIANYMVRKLKNPSRRAINEMYNFLEHKNMPLSPNGSILAYKGVLKNFFSVSSGKELLVSGRRNEAGQIFNGVGETIEMNRSDVDDDFRQGCSNGLHAGSLQYARDWAKSHDGIIIVIEIDPANVVSVPEDCNCMKLRCCKYKVIGLYNGPLPDTYTAEFSDTSAEDEGTEECPDCGETECSCDTCPDCGESRNDCTCDNYDNEDEGGECSCDTCTCQETSPIDTLLEKTAQEARENKLVVLPVLSNQQSVTQTGEDNIRQRFVTVVCEEMGCNPNDVLDSKRFIEDLGADSLDVVELVMMLEEEFNVEIPDEVAETCATVGEGIAAIRDMLHQKQITASKSIDSKPVVKVAEQNEQDVDTYQKGYQLGLRNGVRRRARLYRQSDENSLTKFADSIEFIKGYNDGYRAGRKDYKH